MIDRSSFLALLATAAVERAPAPVRIVALGDSLALATGATRADGGFIFPAYRTVLERRPGSRIDSFAIGGATVADVARLQLPRLAAAAYDVAIVCVGGNDVVQRTPAGEFQRNYAALIDGMRQRAPDIRIVCCGVPDVSISPLFANEAARIRELSARDNANVRAIAAAARAGFVDLFAASRRMRDPGRFLAHDHFHPSDAGYAILTAALDPVLRRFVP